MDQEPQQPQPANQPNLEPDAPSTNPLPQLIRPSSTTVQPVRPTEPTSPEPAAYEPSQPHQIFTAGSTPSAGLSPAVRSKKRWPLFAAIVLIVLLLAGGYAFGFYLPNRPSSVFTTSLNNTGKAVDKLIAYTSSQQAKHYTSYNFAGSLKVKSPSVSFDATTTGSGDQKGNSSLTAKADILGNAVTVDARTVLAQGNATPDLYARVSGVKSFLDSAGLTTFDNLDGQWISVDHTILDTYAASLKKDAGSSGSSATNAPMVPTSAQLTDAMTKLQQVNKTYLFTSDSSKAVLTQQKYLGMETKNGRSAYHYRVGYNKQHLQAYVNALKPALDSSALNAWSKKANDGKNLSQVIDFSSLEDAITSAKSDYTFDMWVDKGTKLVQSLEFSDPANKASTFTLAQNYTGGTTYPFALSFADKETDSNQKGSLTLNVDTKTGKFTGNLSANGTDSTGATDVSGDFTVTPSHKTVTVTAPTGAKSITDVLAQFGLNDLNSGSSATDTSSATDNSLFTFTQ